MKNRTSPAKPAERDREQTEQRLLDTLGEMVREQGFERIGINALAERSGVSKILIYRYFSSIEGLMTAYIRHHDFWINFSVEIPVDADLRTYVKALFRDQAQRLRNDPVLRRLTRWELSADNSLTVQLREQRERAGIEIVRAVSARTRRSEAEVAPIATVLSAAQTYLALLSEFSPVYNGIPLADDAGWEQLRSGVDMLIDNWFSTNGL